MSSFITSWPEAFVLVAACIAYATFMWLNFRLGRYVILWSSIGIVFIQTLSAIGSPNTPAYLAAAGFHAAMVAAIFTATRKDATKALARATVSTRE